MKKLFMQFLLTTPYAATLALRNLLYKAGILKTESPALPTFCVGNVVAGGSGKTPFTAFLVQSLKELGFKPAILLRGYKGKAYGPKLVSSNDEVNQVGDEALLHLRNDVPVIVAKNRIAGVNFIRNNKLANCVVMDDGLQHLAIKANHNFLLLDISDTSAISKWRQGTLLPLGLLRESLESALNRADSIVLVNKLSKNFSDFNFNKKTFKFTITSGKIVDLFDDGEINKLENSNILCAIANPNSFIKSVENLAIKVDKKYIFPDHYQLNQKDWEKIEFPIITTSKDAIKLKQFVKERKQVFVLEQNSSICESSELRNLLREVVNEK